MEDGPIKKKFKSKIFLQSNQMQNMSNNNYHEMLALTANFRSIFKPAYLDQTFSQVKQQFSNMQVIKMNNCLGEIGIPDKYSGEIERPIMIQGIQKEYKVVKRNSQLYPQYTIIGNDAKEYLYLLQQGDQEDKTFILREIQV